ncbi:hypothetical protein E5Q_03436 [Mixia osmundae IAM 14324]|uniref:Arginine biosynthesis bifunctional protein ArgJ, mitochondrial n=1 Tax=Mixia osmundae (strain CBS 9802 / IAM 14324 / JCM 22182 / KY 12970) TaxID=764103 RepID=G7E1Q5_MIXOS|nr:hypothetical protein E5Q_03436 [Mixia osmundae IAM 14324]
MKRRLARVGWQQRRSFTPTTSVPPNKQKFLLDPAEATFPRGFLASGVHCGIKKSSALDLSLIVSSTPASAAACFTRNFFQAAPVQISREVLRSQAGIARALVVNSGCANAVTGQQGLKDARAMSDRVNRWLQTGTHDRSKPDASQTTPEGTGTLVMSTGVIGQTLPMSRISAGIESAFRTMSSSYEAWTEAARGFMTTDTFPKLKTRAFQLGGKEVRLVGIDKGAGMIHPNMGPPKATMLGMIATDAAIAPSALQDALTHAIDRSFNSISVDGDLSTNDTVIALANGQAQSAPIDSTSSSDYELFRDELTQFSIDLASLVVRDGEGATKFVKVSVEEAPTYAGAHTIAATISRSSLIKCALHGADANWGRILCAVGYSSPDFEIDPMKVSLSFIPHDGTEPLRLLVKGEPAHFDEDRAHKMLLEDEIEIRVQLGLGDQSAAYYTCDLSKEYISINADYRS